MRQKRERLVKQPDLELMLAAIPLGPSVRISIARSLGVNDYVDGGQVRRLVELVGLVVQGPFSVDELLRRHGPGEYRVTAYGLEPFGLRFEVICTISNK